VNIRNIGASIRTQLLNKARTEKLDYNLVLTRYALERMLDRLSRGPWAESLVRSALKFGVAQ